MGDTTADQIAPDIRRTIKAADETDLNARIELACRRACASIAPAWPLDRAIAVNPHWSRIGMPLRRVAARMAALGGIHVFPSRAQQLDAWRSGRIRHADLQAALCQLPDVQALGLTPEHCIHALQHKPILQQLPLLIDVLDNDPYRHTRLSWRQAITHQVSQTCAAYFDEHQADWQPERSTGLYAFWRDTLGLPVRQRVRIGVRFIGKIQPFEHFPDTPAVLLHTGKILREQYVLGHGQAGKQMQALEDDADIAAAEAVKIACQ